MRRVRVSSARRTPPMIRREIYAILCCCQAIRALISHVDGDAGLDPARISFTRARNEIRSRISDSGRFPSDGLDAGLAFEINFARNLIPEYPSARGRRYGRKIKRPGGRYKAANLARAPG